MKRLIALLFVSASAVALAACGDDSSPTAPNGLLVSLTASPSSVEFNGSTELQWNAPSATSCEASGGWWGERPTSGTETVDGLTADTDFVLTCRDTAGKTGRASVTVQVTPPAFDESAYWMDYPQNPAKLSGAIGQTNVIGRVNQRSPTWISRTTELKEKRNVVDDHFGGRSHSHFRGWIEGIGDTRDGSTYVTDGHLTRDEEFQIVGVTLAVGTRNGNDIGVVGCSIIFGDNHVFLRNGRAPEGHFRRDGSTLEIRSRATGQFTRGEGDFCN